MEAQTDLRLALKQQYLGVVHEASAEALDLFVGSDRTEGNLPKVLLVEGAVGDAPHHISFPPDDGHRAMPPIKHQAGNVLSRHVGQLLGKDVLQGYEPIKQQQSSDYGCCCFEKMFFSAMSL